MKFFVRCKNCGEDTERDLNRKSATCFLCKKLRKIKREVVIAMRRKRFAVHKKLLKQK